MVASSRGSPGPMPKVKLAKMGQEDVHIQVLAEQRKTNQLLLMLIEAMGEEDSDPDDEAKTYMDGTPVAQ